MGEPKVSGKTAQSQEQHTPETDHLCWIWTQCTEDNSVPPFDDVRGSEMVFADLARKLEAERDQLREQNKELVEALQSCAITISQMKQGMDPIVLGFLQGLPGIEEKARAMLAKLK